MNIMVLDNGYEPSPSPSLFVSPSPSLIVSPSPSLAVPLSLPLSLSPLSLLYSPSSKQQRR